MIVLARFECPKCSKLLCKADGGVVEGYCGRCKRVVRAVRQSLTLSLECTRCGRRHYFETPASRPTYCVACGTSSLAEVVPAQVREGVEVGATA